jgi:hypothetical protein
MARRATMNNDDERVSGAEPNGSPSPRTPRRQPTRKPDRHRRAPANQDALQRLTEAAKTPAAGAALTGTVVLGLASLLGAGPTALGVGVAYGVYLLVDRGKRSS